MLTRLAPFIYLAATAYLGAEIARQEALQQYAAAAAMKQAVLFAALTPPLPLAVAR